MRRIVIPVAAASAAFTFAAQAQVPPECDFGTGGVAVLDANHDGRIGEDEFLACIRTAGGELSEKEMAELRRRFSQWDDDGDGALAADEIESAARSAAVPTLQVEIRYLPAEVTIRQPPPEVIVRQGGEPVAAEVSFTHVKPLLVQAQGGSQPDVSEKAPAAPRGEAAPTGTAAPDGTSAQPRPGPGGLSGAPEGSPTTERVPGMGGAGGPAGPPPGKAEAATGVAVPDGQAGGSQSGEAAAAALAPPDPQALQEKAGLEAVTLDGKRVGEFAKVVVDPGGVLGAVIETGGLMGIGETRHVVPLDKIRMQHEQIVVEMTEAELDKTPILETGRWNNLKKRP